MQKENSLSWREEKAIVHKRAEKSPLLKKTSSLPNENLASTTQLLYSTQFGGSWLYILALEQEMKVEGVSGATSALKLTRTQAMKCWSGKPREARRHARGRTKQAVTEHFILLLKLQIASDVQSSTISCFRSHRPIEMNQPEAPFYLAVKHQRKATDAVWYKKSPLGKNEIGKLLTKAAQNAGLPGRVTNHSVQKTCISRLLDSDVPENYVAQLSGHRNLKSLDSYKSASIQHQRRMSLALSRSATTTSELQAVGNTQATITVESTSMTTTKEAGSGIFQGANFQNCSLNIQITNHDQPPLRKRRVI